jgi:hypothetical protein
MVEDVNLVARFSLVAAAPPGLRRLILSGLVGTVALVAIQAATQAIDYSAYNLRLYALNSDKHASVFGVVSLLAQAAVAAAAAYRARQAEQPRVPWMALSALVGVLGLVRGLTAFNAALLAAPLAATFVLVAWLTRRDPILTRAIVWAALGLMAISLLLHKVGLAADASTASDFTWAYQLTGMVKHGCELAGWMLLTTGVLAGARAQPGIPVGAGHARLWSIGSRSSERAES